MNNLPEPDPWDGQLERVPAIGQTVEFRQALLLRTTRLVRRRVWVKRAATVSALAACYAAGLLTMHWAAPRPNQIETQVASAQVSSGPKKVDDPPKIEALQPPAEASAEILEQWGPLVDPERRPALYRRAGDRYYADNSDLQGALRCYRLALDAGSQTDLQIAAEDNWLLIALKEARTKEKKNATN
jgi:hypothetical protein